MYVRVTKTVEDRGVLVRPQDIDKTVNDPKADWYYSAFTYGEDALEYWEANNSSIKGYNGAAWTSTLYFDLDCESDFGKVRASAKKLVAMLEKLDLGSAVEVYFSGNKGFHILVHTLNKFNPLETSMICYNLAKEANIPDDVFDTSVYNVTRIFRVPNTRHKKSGLYKIPITFEELETLSEEEIRHLAKEPRLEELTTEKIDVEFLRKKYVIEKVKQNNVVDLKVVSNEPAVAVTESGGIDFSKCPPGERRCIYAIQEGHFGPGERHNAIIRLAAYYKGKGFSRSHVYRVIAESLEKRNRIHPGVNAASEEENNRDIDQVYSKDWKGGTFTCKTDIFLQSKCDQGNGPCYHDLTNRNRNVFTIDQLFNEYVLYGEDARVDYPKFGIEWLDEKVRLRPKNFSIINGANGSGKTSLAIEAIENFNNQKLYNIMFSMDMAESSLFEKLGAKYTPFTQREIEEAFNANTRNEEIIKTVRDALKEKLPYTFFDFSSSADIAYIEETTMRLQDSGRMIQIIILDYAGRLAGDKDNQFANSTVNALRANDLAKRTNTHVMVLSQVSRENGDHTDPLRTSRVSKDSGSWEENATIVMNCWRPFGNGLHEEDKYMHVYIAKNRSGSLGEHVFKWVGKTGKISELDHKELQTYMKLCESKQIDVFVDNFAREDAPLNEKFNTEVHTGPRIKHEDDDGKKLSGFKRFSKPK